MNPHLAGTTIVPPRQHLRLFAAHPSRLILEIIANQEFPYGLLLCTLHRVVGPQRLNRGPGCQSHPGPHTLPRPDYLTKALKSTDYLIESRHGTCNWNRQIRHWACDAIPSTPHSLIARALWLHPYPSSQRGNGPGVQGSKFSYGRTTLTANQGNPSASVISASEVDHSPFTKAASALQRPWSALTPYPRSMERSG